MPQPTVAILGASSDRSKFGNKSLRAHARAGFAVYPVNPKGGTIEGVAAYATLDDRKINALHPALKDHRAQQKCDNPWHQKGRHDGENGRVKGLPKSGQFKNAVQVHEVR
jgi:hypothetical protein